MVILLVAGGGACPRAARRAPADAGISSPIPSRERDPRAPAGGLAPGPEAVVPAVPGESVRRDGSPSAARTAPPARRVCPSHKIAFSRRTGCINDGSVEFCVPKGNRSLLRRLRRVAGSLRYSGGRGRARCDPSREALYLLPTRRNDPAVCGRGGLTVAAWSRICALASFPEIRRIVPTFFE